MQLLLKCLARGLAFQEGSYLSDPWNWLDVAVVAPFWILLALPNIPSFASLQVRAERLWHSLLTHLAHLAFRHTPHGAHSSRCSLLRLTHPIDSTADALSTHRLLPLIPQLARALRPLRTLRNFPVLRRTVVAFLKAGPALTSVVAFTLFFYIVFGIVGVRARLGVQRPNLLAPTSAARTSA